MDKIRGTGTQQYREIVRLMETHIAGDTSH